MSRLTTLVLAAALPLPALADPIDARSARDLLFRGDDVEVIQVDMAGLSEQEITVLTTVARTQKYYAAIAFAPAQGIMAEPTVMAANHHSPESARAAALAGCNERRGRSGRACVIALEVRPVGWEERDLMLSIDATEAFNDEYRRRRGTRAFAGSALTGQWGIGLGDGAAESAIAACRGDSEVSDCAVLIED